MQDLQSFYHSEWTSTFIPAYIMQVGVNASPWSPSFNTIDVMQQIRDTIYPNSDHVLDKDSAVYRIVSNCSLLTYQY
jgi:hypothetical protein